MRLENGVSGSDVFYCPHCKQPLYDQDALRCLYCGERLDVKAGPSSIITWRKARFFVALLVLLVILAFLSLMVF
ncbi:MAG: hypothetical protein U9Q08_04585 [Candidatus Omnitrophota bacterium]|nr:hypothetical protein [Candidatus Omnitrophota bacterium]